MAAKMSKAKKIRTKEKIDIMRLEPIGILDLLHQGMPGLYGLNKVRHGDEKRCGHAFQSAVFNNFSSKKIYLGRSIPCYVITHGIPVNANLVLSVGEGLQLFAFLLISSVANFNQNINQPKI